MGFLLRQYLNSVEYLVGIDISSEKVEKAKRLGLYDELYVADIRDFTYRSYFDTLIAIEVLHGLELDVIGRIERFVRRGGLVVITLPSLPQGVTVKDLINRGYNVYRYLLRGLVLIDLKDYSVYLAGQSRFLKAVKILLMLLRLLLRVTKLLERGYLIAFKEVRMFMKVLPVEVLSVKTPNGRIYVLVKRGEKIVLQVLDKNLKVIDELISMNGNRGFIFKILREGILVCVDSMLHLVRDGKAEMF